MRIKQCIKLAQRSVSENKTSENMLIESFELRIRITLKVGVIRKLELYLFAYYVYWIIITFLEL